MPVRGQRSQAAKQKQHQGLSVFAKQANAQSTPSPDGSVYYLSDGNTDMSTTVTDSSSGGSRNNQAVMSREGLQHLYSVFLPPHLQLNEDGQEKRQRTSKRSAVYTKDSRTTA